MPAVWVERVRRSVRRKPAVSSKGEGKDGGLAEKEMDTVVSFLCECLRNFPEAKEAVLAGLRRLRENPLDPLWGGT